MSTVDAESNVTNVWAGKTLLLEQPTLVFPRDGTKGTVVPTREIVERGILKDGLSKVK
ncbi:hypothetical protein HPP92_018758 [Vanilla planifolia]|uniref:Uncharacterized protein n=1 Tax=Vanilla planifolia TaxID=51239 RepID=A0A835QE66_VANPL|nr:hypothetical protein HPP92_018758 [Vanilla planifolia]